MKRKPSLSSYFTGSQMLKYLAVGGLLWLAIKTFGSPSTGIKLTNAQRESINQLNLRYSVDGQLRDAGSGRVYWTARVLPDALLNAQTFLPLTDADMVNKTVVISPDGYVNH